MNIFIDYTSSTLAAEYDRLLAQIAMESMLTRDAVASYVLAQATISPRATLDILRDVAAEVHTMFALGKEYKLPVKEKRVRQPEASGTFEFTVSARAVDALLIRTVPVNDERVAAPLNERIGAIVKTLYVTPQEAECLVQAIAKWNRQQNETALGEAD